jgi:hypothetical protein
MIVLGIAMGGTRLDTGAGNHVGGDGRGGEKAGSKKNGKAAHDRAPEWMGFAPPPNVSDTL